MNGLAVKSMSIVGLALTTFTPHVRAQTGAASRVMLDLPETAQAPPATSTIGGCSGNVTSFNPSSAASIIAYKDSVGCLSPCLSTVYVDKDATGFQDGTAQFPFHSIPAALAVIHEPGTIVIAANQHPAGLFIDQAVTLRASGGTVAIGP